MFYVLQNESTASLRRVPILLTDAATGTTAQTGVAINTIYPYVNINGGAFAGGAGTVAEAGYGQYYYEFDPSEIATLGLAGIHITAAGCRDYDAIAQIAAFNMYGVGSGISAGDVWSYILNGSGQTAEYQLDTAALQSTDAANNAIAANTQTQNIAGQVWSDDLSAGPNAPYAAGTAGTILYDLSVGGAGLTAGDVWNFPVLGFGITNSAAEYLTGAYTDSANTYTQLVNNTAADIWTYTGVPGRTITGGTADTVSNPVDVTTTSMTGIAGTVWNYGTRTLTSGGSGLTAGDVSNAVWNVPVSSYSTNGTFGLNILRSDAANKSGDVTVYSSGGVNGVDADMHRISNDAAAATALKNILTGIGSSITGNITGNLSGSVGSVTNDVNVSTGSMTGIAGTVWSTATRTITGGTITTVSDKTGYSLSSTQSFNLTGNITGNLSGSVGSVSGAVGSVTSAVTVATASMTGIAGTVWSNATRTITGGTITTVSDKTGYSLSATQSFNLTGNITGSVSGSVGSVSGAVGSVTSPVSVATASMTGIAGTVWATNISGYTSPSAGYSLFNATAGGGITAGDVWSYATRTLTSGGSGISAADVWNYVLADTNTAGTDLVTAASGAGISAGDVWTYGSRTITGGTITTNSDKTGYSLSGTQSFNLTGNITGNLSGSVGSVGSAVDITTGSMSGVAGTVWNYGTRTLTSGGGITAGDVWTYNISGITTSGSAGNALNDAAVSGSVVSIVNGPYRLTSTAEGVDGRIDILQNSVQTINLSLVNGFGQPFNVTGYTLSVDVYDIASALVESYTPTVNYGAGGNISFDIDTTVTAVIGTYSVVVALTNGDVVKVGPITLLVRPL